VGPFESEARARISRWTPEDSTSCPAHRGPENPAGGDHAPEGAADAPKPGWARASEPAADQRLMTTRTAARKRRRTEGSIPDRIGRAPPPRRGKPPDRCRARST